MLGVERHLQRAYRLDEIRTLAESAGLETVAVYDDFAEAPATDATERAHWVWRRAA